MILNYIRPISAIQVEGREWWFSTFDLALIFDTAPFLIAENFKHKKCLLKAGVSTEYINSVTLIQLFNYDPALIKALKTFTTKDITVRSTAETILRIGLVYRAIALNESNTIQTLNYAASTFTTVAKTDPYGLSLPDLLFKNLSKEIAGYYLKAQVLLHSKENIALYDKLAKKYGPCLFDRDDIYSAYLQGFSADTIDMLILEWHNHRNWASSLTTDIETYSIKKHPLQDALVSELKIPVVRLDYLL